MVLFYVTHRLLNQGFLDVIEHITFVVNDAVLTVRGVRSNNVCDNSKLWQSGFGL